MQIYHTESPADYNALMLELDKKGVKWINGAKADGMNIWEYYKELTCIMLNDNVMAYAGYNFFKKKYPHVTIKKYKFADTVNNPNHYTAGGIETLDYIKAKVPDYPSYAVGNIIKYITRYKHKNGIEDLKKAQFYLNDLITFLEGEE
ncbi:DUF3310 domain-containing protein [Listeria booriae]|uniref:DUF3310 domain-containing protein n=1 Tax=Listeria booriae TaxID=1552123 RepID=UPI0016237CB6|nr:DUF3310 domain-containing protein [Listeria booriae]MBC2196289.1 DUF3310 domain-containing protein [Listeria booriae]